MIDVLARSQRLLGKKSTFPGVLIETELTLSSQLRKTPNER